MSTPRVSGRPDRSAVVAACGAAALGFMYAAVSAYWGAGGKALLATVGGAFQKAGENGSAGLVAVVWLTVVLKLLAAALAPCVVLGRPQLGPRRRRDLRRMAWAAAMILSLYGGVLSIAGWLVQVGVLPAGAHADHRALRWHALLWDPWFLLWGLLMVVALSATRARA